MPVVTARGLFINLMIFGVLGADTFGATLAAHPCVPSQVGEIAISGVQFRGRRYRIAASHGNGAADITEL